MAVRLRTVVEGRPDERTVDFPDTVGEIRVGRRQDLELPLPFRALSSVHARLTRDAAGRWSVEDLGSRNGTTLCGVRLGVGERHALAAGSPIGFGVVTVIFDGPVADAPRRAVGAAEGTGTIARRLVNDFFAGEPGAGAPMLAVLRGAPPATLRMDALDRRYVVGRVEEAALQLVVEEISREHAAFTRTWEGVTVLDLGSKNGVRVNGTPATEQRLHDGDVVEIGSVTLRLTDPADRYLRELEAQPDPPLALPEPAPLPAVAPPEPIDPVNPPAVAPPIRPSRSTRTAIIAAALVLLAVGITALALALVD